MVYGVFNNLEVNETDPYDSITEEEETEESGCAAETNPANFWLSFSSILLAVVLLGAIIMLFIKNIRRRRKSNESDAKSHYKITSRTKVSKAKKVKKVEIEDDEYEDENDAEEVEETAPTGGYATQDYIAFLSITALGMLLLLFACVDFFLRRKDRRNSHGRSRSKVSS